MAPRKKNPSKIWVPMNPWFKGDAAKYDLPYFAHEQLDPGIYPFTVGQPVLGAFQLKMDGQLNTVEDFGLGDSSGDEGFSLGPKTPDPSIAKGNNRALASQDKDSAKKLKINGGQAATAKKVSWELDSDDELIVNMKEAGRTEKEIAERLINENRIRYHPKTIGTRWARLKRAIQEHQDELMDAELTDWHEGDDDVLEQAIAKADKEIDFQKAKLDAKKWKLVSDNMKSYKPVTNFSGRACRERKEAKLAGTAKIAPEFIEHKTPKVLERIQSRVDKEQKLLALSVSGEASHKALQGPPKKRRIASNESTPTSGRSTFGLRNSMPALRLKGKGARHDKNTSSISSMDGAMDEMMYDEGAISQGVAEGGEHYDSDTFMNESSSELSSETSSFDPREG